MAISFITLEMMRLLSDGDALGILIVALTINDTAGQKLLLAGNW